LRVVSEEASAASSSRRAAASGSPSVVTAAAITTEYPGGRCSGRIMVAVFAPAWQLFGMRDPVPSTTAVILSS
jgi:hypothetical protein